MSRATERSPDRLSFWMLAALLVAAVLLGGASQSEQWMRLALNGFAAALLAWRLVGAGFAPMTRGAWIILGGVLLFAALLVSQLVPLPPTVWTQLPGRVAVAEGFEVLSAPLPWMPISLSPEQTFLATLDLLPPIAAITLGGSVASSGRTAGLMWLLSALAASSAALGAAQVLSGGASSPLYLHDFSNRGLPTGFFANVNHQASFLLVCSPFLLALFARTARSLADEPDRRGLLAPIGLITLLVAFGVAMAGSVAGWVLSGLVLIFGLTLLTRNTPIWIRLLIPMAAVGAAAALVTLALSSPVLANKGIGLTENSTSLSSRLTTVQAALPIVVEYFPAGAGFGSFRSVFAAHEDPATVQYNFMNQAHNDWLEVPLEGGAAGLMVIGSAIALLLVGNVRAWTARSRDSAVARAASIGLLVLALHSLVDYPLRTSSLATIAALFAALMISLKSDRREKSKHTKKDAPLHRQIRL